MCQMSFEALHEKQTGEVGRISFYHRGRALGLRNIFLDGNTFRDSHSVDKRRWLVMLSLD
jgi:hypothetical protein